MKNIALIFLAAFFVHGVPLFCLQAEAAPKRFKITNEMSGLHFQVEREDGVLGDLQPEWGKPQREVRCDEVPAGESERIVSRRTETVLEQPFEICTVKDQFVITEEDITAEREAAQAKEKNRRDAKERLKALDIRARIQSATTIAQLRQALLDILPDLMEVSEK